MLRRKSFVMLSLLLIAMLAVACSSPEAVVTEVIKEVEVTRVVVEETVVEGETVEVEVTRVVVEEVEVEVPAMSDGAMDNAVTLNLNWGTEPPTVDPQLATDTTSVAIAGNIFVGLTKFDPVSGALTPYLATDWVAGEDADGNQTWTFNLRGDIPWITYNPSTGEATQLTDADGNARFVNAHDVVYGVKRALNPDTASDYSYVLYGINNAADVNGGSEELTLDDVGVVAIDDTTVQFTLASPAGFFPSIAGLWTGYPVPEEVINEWGNKWTEPGLIATSGPYTIESWIHGSQLNLVKNPLWVDADSVQIERIEGVMIQEESTAFALYEDNQLDTNGVPSADLDRVRVDDVLAGEYRSTPVPCTYYYGFVNNKYPFTDARVRRAFSMAIDRQSIVDNVTKAGQVPASSFAPPGMFGAPEPGTVGVFTDAAAAAAELQSFLDDEGLTIEEFNALNITLMHNTSEGHANIAAAAQQMWLDALGVNVNVENQEWAVYLDTIGNSTPLNEAPHIYRLGWCADYPDENNWVHEVFNAEAGGNRLRRGCVDEVCTDIVTSEFDELTTAAGLSQDPAERIELYAQAEEMLASDIAGYAPIYHYVSSNVTKPWLTRNFPSLGAPDYYNWTIDMDAKNAAQ